MGFVKVICIIEDCIDYRIVEDVNRGNLKEAITYISEHGDKYPKGKWEIIPFAM